ncbi:hypothetical protein pb186bvf_017140 [Paramecium bursaria]
MQRDQATKFDQLLKRVSERCKTTETLLVQLLERAETEDKYTKQLEKISLSMQTGGGDIDDLVKGVRVDLNQRSQYCKQFNVSFRNDLDTAISEIKQIQLQFKPVVAEIVKQDKELKLSYDKYDKQKEKTIKANKDYEEAAITLEAILWNKESTLDQRTRGFQKLNQQLQYRTENETNLKQLGQLCNNALNTFNQTLTQATSQLSIVFTQVFAMAKDMVMKTLVYEISKIRNLQYDSEQFFKEVEKYDDPQEDPLSLYKPVSLSIQNSFLRQIADNISLNHKINNKIVAPETDQEALQYLNNDIFISDLRKQTVKLIQKINNKNQKQEKTNDPLASETSVQGVYGIYKASYPEQELQQIFSFLKHCVQLSHNEEIKNWKEFNSEDIQFDDLIQKKLYRELGVVVLESFRLAGCPLISENAYNRLISYSSKLLEVTQREGELSYVKRILMMISSIYKCDENDKRIYLQDGLINLQLWKQIDLWEGLIYVTIEEEIDKSDLKLQGQQFTKEQIFKDKTVIFNNLYMQTMSMINFKVEKQEIKQVLIKYGRVFGLYDLQTQELLNFVENGGKVDLDKNINSLSVLQSLYQTSSSNDGQQIKNGQHVQKRVLIFNQQQQAKSTSQNQQFFSQMKQDLSEKTTPVLQNVQEEGIDTPTRQEQTQQGQKQVSQQQGEKRYNQHPLEPPKAGFLKQLPK